MSGAEYTIRTSGRIILYSVLEEKFHEVYQLEYQNFAESEGDEYSDKDWIFVTRTAPTYTRLYHAFWTLTNQMCLDFSKVKNLITLLKLTDPFLPYDSTEI